MALVNSEFAIFDKQGNILFGTPADNWLRNILPSVDAFDPVVIYDHFEGRWVMLWDHWDETASEAFWLISVSDDSDPMGTWCSFAFPANLNGMVNDNTWGDYPKMAYDEQAVYVSGRQFGFSGDFNYCKIRIIPKDQLYDLSCGPVDYTDFWNFRDPDNLGMTVDGPPIAASHHDPSDNKAYFVVDSPYYTSEFITLWTIEDPLGASPTVTGVNIPTTAALGAPDADQLGGGTPRIDGGRRAYRNAVYQNGQIWTATAVAGGTANQYSFARYLRFHVNSLTVIEDVAFGVFGYQYTASGIVSDATSSDPVDLAAVIVRETGNTITTDSSGAYSFASPFAAVTLFYAEGNPYPGPYVTVSTNASGDFSVQTIMGTYDIIARPGSPYSSEVRFDDLVLVEGGTTAELEVTPVEVMLVDDDGGSNYESYFTDALINIDITYHLWSNDVAGEPSPADIGAYPDSIVVWFTGDGDATTLNASEITTLTGHLNNGGSLFLTGQNIAEQIDGSELMDLLGISYLQDNANSLVSGVTGSFTEGMLYTTNGVGGANNQTSRDEIVITNDATTSEIFRYGVADSAVAGVAYHEGTARAVHLDFGWEAIFNADTREEVMNAILGYFDPGLGVEDSPPTAQLPAAYQLLQNYPNPFNPSTTIRFDLPGNEGEKRIVTIVVYDMRGRRVRMLIDSGLEPGNHQAHWNGRNDRGESVASGIYLYTLNAGGERFTRKMTILK